MSNQKVLLEILRLFCAFGVELCPVANLCLIDLIGLPLFLKKPARQTSRLR